MTRTILAIPSQIVDCPACGGTGQHTLDPDYECPRCEGYGTLVRTVTEDGITWEESHGVHALPADLQALEPITGELPF